MAFTIGERVADYEVEGLIGTGGMGRVYRVRNVISQRTEAMKVLLADLQAEPELAARFVTEIRTLAALDHPNIAQLHTALQTANELVMLMEFVEGLTLQQMTKEGSIPPKKVLDYMQQVLAALSFAHARGVVHRDIKPANIMVTSYGVVKLTDFGIAKSKTKSELTHPGTTVGSLHYMSPEQARGSSSLDNRSDLYSLGITMYELLAGRLPFEDESTYHLLQRHLTDAPVPPLEANPHLSAQLNRVILKALEKDPGRRYQDAASFSDALAEATGIVARVPVERAPASSVSARMGRSFAGHLRKPVTTSRLLIASHRRLWMVMEALAAAGLIAGFSMVHFHFGRAREVSRHAEQAVRSHTASAVVPPIAAPTPAEPTVPASTNRLDLTPPDLSQHPQRVLHDQILPHRRVAPAPSVTTAEAGQPSAAMAASQDDAGVEATPPHSVPARASAAELDALRVQKETLEARAAAVRTSVLRLKGQREAEGNGLGQDIADAYVRMNAYLSAEKSDVEDGDIAAARDHLEKAAHEVSLLEGIFNGPSASNQTPNAR